jgi:hypothetical protein
MRRAMASLLSLAACMLVLSPCSSVRAEDAPADEAMKLATRITTEGAALFDTFDAKAMAATYTEDAELALVTRENGELNTKTYKGREEIEREYEEIFKNPETIKSKNTVEYARFLSDDVLAIAGTFDTNTLKPDSIKVPFYQVRVKQGDKWLMASLRIFVLPKD